MSLTWSYGITTVPDRLQNGLVHRTIKSLEHAGFPHPRLFIDGLSAKEWAENDYGLGHLPVTTRGDRVRTFGNWILAAWELYVRQPKADRYAIFQDDFVTYKNLRLYLEACPHPDKGYLNLYTFPQNERPQSGWYLSNQLGKGAVALVFSNEAMRVLLQAQHMVDRPLDLVRGHKAVDGGIVTAFKKAGWKEWVHNPSLVQHTGEQSTMGNARHKLASTFRGEDFDALDLIETTPPPKRSGLTQRIGIVGYSSWTGIGEIADQIVRYCDVDACLLKPRLKPRPLPTDYADVITCPRGDPRKIKRFLELVDTVVFVEGPPYSNLLPMAKAMSKRIVCIAMLPWVPEGDSWTKDVDLFVCPTQQCFQALKDSLPCVDFSPWPFDTQKFRFRERKTLESFLFVNGMGGFKGRKGADVLKAILEAEPSLKDRVHCNSLVGEDLPNQFSVEENQSLYERGDALIYPALFDGIGLQPLEAMACGLLTIVPDAATWNEVPHGRFMPARVETRAIRAGRIMDAARVDVKKAAWLLKSLIGRNISDESKRLREYAEANSWKHRAEELNELARTGKCKIRLPA